MAVERRKTKLSLNIGDFLNQQRILLNTARIKNQQKLEGVFQTRVLEDNLSLEAQVEHYKELNEKEKEKSIPDNNYILSNKKKIADLKKRIKWRNWRNDFLTSLNDYKAGRKTADEHLDFLQNELANTQDEEMRENIRAQIGDTEAVIKKDYENLIDAKLTLAAQDGTEEALKKGISEAEKEQSKALIEKDDTRATAMSSVITSLKRDLEVAKIEDKLTDIEIDFNGGGTYDDKLNALSNLAKTASEDLTKLRINGNEYSSVKEFYQSVLNNFINTDYFKGKEKELKNKLASVNNYLGDMPVDELLKIKNEMNNSLNNEALIPYDANKTQLIQNVLNYGLGLKITKLNKDLQLKDDKKGIQNIRDEVKILAEKIPEISENPNLATLSLVYAKKQRELLQNKLENLASIKRAEINDLKVKVNSGNIDEKIKETINEKIAKADKDLNSFILNSSTIDIPYSELGFDSNVDEIAKKIVNNYPTLTTSIEIPSLKETKPEQIIHQGLKEERSKILPENKQPVLQPKPQFQIPTGYEKIPHPSLTKNYTDVHPDPTNTFLYGKKKPVEKTITPTQPKSQFQTIYYKGKKDTTMKVLPNDVPDWEKQGWKTSISSQPVQKIQTSSGGGSSSQPVQRTQVSSGGGSSAQIKQPGYALSQAEAAARSKNAPAGWRVSAKTGRLEKI